MKRHFYEKKITIFKIKQRSEKWSFLDFTFFQKLTFFSYMSHWKTEDAYLLLFLIFLIEYIKKSSFTQIGNEVSWITFSDTCGSHFDTMLNKW